MKTTIKTISWEDGGAIFLEEARRVWGDFFLTPPADFRSFIKSLPDASSDILSFWLDNVVNSYHLQDFTKSVTKDEDACLFYASSEAEVLNILIGYLQNHTLPAEWCYLDNEKKAIAHFVKRNDGVYYAELYCMGKENSSYLHFRTEGPNSFLIPVTFMEKLPELLNMCSAVVLHDYLPGDLWDTLHQKGTRPRSNQTRRLPVTGLDRGDSDTL